MDPFEKSTTVDVEVRAYVTSLVNAVGGRSTYDDSYSVGDDAVAVLKDLQRWLRLYDEKTDRHDVKRVLAEANLVKGDLLEILSLCAEDAENKHRAKLALACLELLVPLTWPLQLDGEKATLNHHRHIPYLQLAQVAYKRAVLQFEGAKILRTVARSALPAMATERRARSKRDEGILKLIMYFFRNIAIITQPQHLPSQGDENDISPSATIDAFHEQDIFKVLLTIGSGMGEDFQEQDVILLELLFHLLKGVDGRKLFMKKEHVNSEETTELKNLLQKEKAMVDSYKRHAPTRHNRFGTMIWVKRDDEKLSTVSGQGSMTTNETDTLRQMDASKKWNKPLYRGKLPREFDENSEFGMRVKLTDRARRHLRTFVEDFLDSSFNHLFSMLRKAIEREADRVQSMHHKQYFYLISWFLNAEAARRDQSRREGAWNADRPMQANSQDNTFAYIAAVLDQETFVLLNRRMQSAFDDKNWQDLQATLLCFTQILLTVQSMADSKDEEDQEIAENIQNRIFYEESTHDRIVQVLRGYSHQGFAYLDAVTECVHVFLRLLERYSKQNVDMQIRSKRRARKKRQQQTTGEGGEGAEDAAEVAREVARAVTERKFDFAKYSAKFLSQQCVDTFISLIRYHRDLTPVQLKRAHRYLYRLAFKHELAILLFRVDILALLHKLIKGPEGLDPAMEGYKDWEQLVQQVFRRCIKWMERDTTGDGWREACVVEMLFSKIPNTMFYLQNGYEKVVEKRAPRPPAELELKPSVAEEQRIAVAASLLIEQAKAGELDWIKKQLQNAAEERQSWEDDQAARMGLVSLEDREEAAADAPEPLPAPTIFLSPDNDERKLALFKDKHLRLLLTTLGFQRLGLAEDTDADWIIPSELSAAQLTDAINQIKKAEFDPPTFDDDKTAADLVRSKAAARGGTTFDDNDYDTNASGSGGDIDEAMFPPNLKEKRKRKDGEDKPRKRRKIDVTGVERTEEELEEKRRAKDLKEKEKNARIKSKLFITESDEESDAEADAEFFRLEEERRKHTAGVIRNALLKQMDDDESGKKKEMKKATKPKKKSTPAKKPSKKKKTNSDNEDQIMLDVGDEESSADDTDEEPAPARKQSRKSSPVEIDSSADDEAQPPPRAMRKSSPIELSDNHESSSMHSDEDGEVDQANTGVTSPLREISVNKSNTRIVDSDDEDEEPITKSVARRNVRAGFIIDDSDDEEVDR